MFCWGKAQEGQLGLGGIEEDTIVSPRFVDTTSSVPSKINEVACGWNHTAFLTAEGTVYTCGNNEFGQLGQDRAQMKPEMVSALDTFMIRQVACGELHTLAVSDRGFVFSWGCNRHGQLGVEKSCTDKHPIPRKIKHLSQMTIVQVACGANHSLALTNGGHIFSWGKNDHGQLGIGTCTDKCTPQHMSSLNGVPFAQITAGGYHSFALTLSGAIFGWGKNSCGQLGTNNGKDHFMPVLLRSLRSQHAKYIACGEDHTAVLTEDGGVFTFGSGRFGQLGHNSYNNENNPRKVFELMGSIVTQIACGRNHTLAFVQSSGKLYGFGLGASGQLGVKISNVNSPFPVWKEKRIRANSKLNSMDLTDAPEYEVEQLSSGGDHCVVLATKPRESREPADFRRHSLAKHVLFLSEASVKELVKQISVSNGTSDIKNLEMIFSSQACLNASFLDSKTHEKTNSRMHGINLPSARRAFSVLGSIPHPKIVQLICTSVEHHLIPSLMQQSPPDIEALRVYILIPECDFLHKGNLLDTISIKFGEAIRKLSTEAQKVLRRWWSSLPSTFFARTMQVFQNSARRLLEVPNSRSANSEILRRKVALDTCMRVLAQLNDVNSESGDIVPFNHFYIPEIQDKVDIRADYFNWIQNDKMFSFCQFPFVFDARAKTLLLQTDAIMQMQTAVEEANRRNAYGFFSGMLIDPVNPCLVIVVRRENIVQDTLLQITKHGPYDLKKPLKVVFVGEEGVDAGGVRKEFFLLVLTEILDPKYGMFTYIEESHTIWFNDLSFEEEPMFLLVGVICGLAIYNSMIIDLRFPSVLYKRLLGRKPNIDDFRSFQPSVARNLQYVLDYEEDDIEEVFEINFQVVREKYGALQYIDLIPGGGQVAVTQENKQQYVELYIDYYLNKAVEKQFEAFNTGFHRVCGGRVLEFFHPQELMEMVVGCQEFDFRELEKVAEYKGEFYRGHSVIRHFWDVFHEFSVKLKKKFLAFLTGSDRVPITGISSMKIIIQPVAGGEEGNHLPVAHTCFNLLDLPRYPTKEMMKTKLSQAIEFSTGFGLA